LELVLRQQGQQTVGLRLLRSGSRGTWRNYGGVGAAVGYVFRKVVIVFWVLPQEVMTFWLPIQVKRKK
jgi:hypothetical protein